jgi:hypothetical protein
MCHLLGGFLFGLFSPLFCGQDPNDPRHAEQLLVQRKQARAADAARKGHFFRLESPSTLLAPSPDKVMVLTLISLSLPVLIAAFSNQVREELLQLRARGVVELRSKTIPLLDSEIPPTLAAARYSRRQPPPPLLTVMLLSIHQ